MEKSAPFVMAALLLLLQAGADPNFDEVFVEEAVRDKEHHTAFGRKPYPSALHCLMDAAHNYMEEVSDAEHVRKYVYKCCELLLHHGADPSYVGKYYDSHNDTVERRGNALHALCNITPQLGRVDSTLLLLLLRHGANPDACVDGQFPLLTYVEALQPRSASPPPPPSDTSRRNSLRDASPSQGNVPVWGTVGQRSDDDRTSDDVVDARRMCRMVGFMSHTSQHQCASLLRSRLAAPSAQRSQSFSPSTGLVLKMALREVEKYTTSAPSLRRCCAITVWCHCRRHIGNVYKLPIPSPLINTVMDYI